MADFFRSRAREVEAILDDMNPEAFPDQANSPDAMVARVAVDATLALLPAAAREVLILCNILGLPSKEAAGILGLTPNALRVRLHRARQRFRVLNRHGE